jgi:hypothetical protein
VIKVTVLLLPYRNQLWYSLLTRADSPTKKGKAMDIAITFEFNKKTQTNEYRNMTAKAVVDEIKDLTVSENKILKVIYLDGSK